MTVATATGIIQMPPMSMLACPSFCPWLFFECSNLLDIILIIISINMMMFEAASGKFRLEHKIQLLVASAFSFRQSEKGPDHSKEGESKPEEASFPYILTKSVSQRTRRVQLERPEHTFPIPSGRIHHIWLDDVGNNLRNIVSGSCQYHRL